MTPASLSWRYRAHPGPTAAHLWAPEAPNPLCGLTRSSSGEWRPAAPERVGRCGLCERRRERYYPTVPVENP